MRYLPNGQWTLEKSEPGKPSIHSLVGQTHTVEVHPDIDHLHRVKGMIKDSGKSHMQLADIKRAGVSSALIRKLPRDARGKVSSEMIDKHIEGLPKQKVQIKVAPYEMKSQQHRDAPQYVASVGFHPDTLKNAGEGHQKSWESLKNKQHDLSGHENQIGWARIDPHKVEQTSNGHKVSPNDKHWHLDEIQSDFGNKDKLDAKSNFENHWWDETNKIKKDDKHPLHEDWKKFDEANKKHEAEVNVHSPTGHLRAKEEQKLSTFKPFDDAQRTLERKVKEHLKEQHKHDPSSDEIHKFLSHGHEDPQHLVHSAVNQLARQHGIESTSMDTPEDQARQSHLQNDEDRNHEEDTGQDALNQYDEWQNHRNDWLDQEFTPKDIKREATENPEYSGNKYLKDAIEKVPHDSLRQIMNDASHDQTIVDFRGTLNGRRHLEQLNDQEKDALAEYLGHWHGNGPQINEHAFDHTHDPEESYEVPVHQLNTYDKRPKKLGAQLVDKKQLLGDDPKDKAKQVQYMRLHKKLEQIKDLLKKV